MQWLEQYKEASPQTKWFIFNSLFYGFLIIATLIYCYARLDFVRTGPTKTPTTELKNDHKA